MRRLICLIAVVAGIPLLGCTQSVERAQRDVRTAHENAAQNVREEQKDLEDVKRDASERIARQERRVEDAAREGTKDIIEEQRDVEDAKRAEAQRDRDNTLPPRDPLPPRDLNDTTPITPAPLP
jgi:hypothetical protein